MKYFATSVFCCIALLAADLRALVIDTNAPGTVDGYSVYYLNNGAQALAGTSTTTNIDLLNVPDGKHTVAATAFNQGGESDLSPILGFEVRDGVLVEGPQKPGVVQLAAIVNPFALFPAASGFTVKDGFPSSVAEQSWTFAANTSVSSERLNTTNTSWSESYFLIPSSETEVWVYCLINTSSGGGSSYANNPDIIRIKAGGTLLAAIQYEKTGGRKFRVKSSTSSTDFAPGAVGDNQTWYFWLHYVSGGTVEAWISSTSTRPASSGGNYRTCTGNTGSADRLAVVAPYISGFYWDSFVVSTSELVDSPY